MHEWRRRLRLDCVVEAGVRGGWQGWVMAAEVGRRRRGYEVPLGHGAGPGRSAIWVGLSARGWSGQACQDDEAGKWCSDKWF